MICICWYNLFTLSPKNITVNVARKVKGWDFGESGRNHKSINPRLRRTQRQKDNSLTGSILEFQGVKIRTNRS